MRVQRVVIGLIAGLVLGSAIGASGSTVALRLADFLLPVGQLWVNAIRMTIVPLVISLLFVGVASRDEGDGFGRVAIASVVMFVVMLLVAALVAVMIVPSLINDMKLTDATATALRGTAQASGAKTTELATQLPGFASWVTGLVPANVIKAVADGAMLPVIVFTLLFALASRKIDASLRASLISFFNAIAGATTTIVDWIIFVAPIGVFALVTAAAARAGIGLAGVTVYYVVAISSALVLFALLTYPIANRLGGVRISVFSRAVLPAQAVALSSSSSLASLPALVEGSRAMGLPVQVSGFVLPFAVSTFKAATPITWLTGTLFLAKLYGVPMSMTACITVVLTAVALSFTTPGVPQGAQLMLAPVLVSYGIPAEGIALLIAADTIPDLFGTMANVTSDLVVGTVVGRFTGDEIPVDDQGELLSDTDHTDLTDLTDSVDDG